jgi:hypothetical protein
MRDLLTRDLLLGAVIGALISLLLIAWVNHQPGTRIELPPFFPRIFPSSIP